MTDPAPDPADRHRDTDFEPERVIIRDNRKIDRDAPTASGEAPASPDGGTGNNGAGATTAPSDTNDGSVPNAEAVLLEERTRDLQRVQAEYANYRRRADRERLAAGDIAVGKTLGELLPIVDDLDRARAHGDLNGALKSVADKLDGVFGKLGLVSFGEVGDPFDPEIHEAVLHDEADTVTVPTCTTVMRVGYKHNERLLRPAMVGVTDPSNVQPAAAANEPPTGTDEN